MNGVILLLILYAFTTLKRPAFPFTWSYPHPFFNIDVPPCTSILLDDTARNWASEMVWKKGGLRFLLQVGRQQLVACSCGVQKQNVQPVNMKLVVALLLPALFIDYAFSTTVQSCSGM
jgi:hypothetical protein